MSDTCPPAHLRGPLPISGIEKLPTGGVKTRSQFLGLLYKYIDPENNQFLMVPLIFQPRQMAGSMLIYWRELSG